MSSTKDFVTLPDAPRLTLANLTVPSCLVGASGSLAPFEITIEGGRIVSGTGERVDMRGAMVFPAFVDLHTVICRARSWTELFALPQSDRIVLRAGRPIDRILPDYAELDDLMAVP